MKNPKFSIITVSYNSNNTIEQTIKSVLMQSYTNFEYIIVDGASTDGTVDIISRFGKEDRRIKYISEPDKGIYDAMNKGIALAKGEVIALLNSDDYYEAGALEKIARVLPNCKEYVVYGMVRIIENEKESEVILSSHNSLPKRMMMHPACFVSKAIYDKYKYDTTYRSAADYDLFLKLYEDSAVSFVPIYEIIANFRLGGMSDSVVSFLESNDIRYKFGYMSKKQRDVSNIGIKVKNRLLKRKKWF